MDISVQTGGLIRFWGSDIGYRMIREAGFTAIDWNLDTVRDRENIKAGRRPGSIFEQSDKEIDDYFKPQLDEIRANGLKIAQAHAPFPAYMPNMPWLTDHMIGVYRNCIRFCQRAGIKYLVIHGISRMIDDYTQTPETIHELNYYLYESLISTLLETEVTVCLENLFTYHGTQIVEGTCSVAAEAVSYIDVLNEKAGKECFGLCLDTGHLNLLGKNQGDFIRTLGSRIKALHLHDNNGMGDDHLAPYTGTIIWKDVMQALKDVGYSGDLNFETFRQIVLDRVDREAVPIWLRTIHDIGEVFYVFQRDD